MTMGLDCCCPSCTATVLYASGGTFAYWSTFYRQCVAVMTITYAGAGGSGCPTTPGSGIVLVPDGSFPSTGTMRRWRNDDGLDCEMTTGPSGVGGTGNIEPKYIRLWNSTGEVIADKSSGAWVLSGNCAIATPPCNVIFQIGFRRYTCIRTASSLPITATLSASDVTADPTPKRCTFADFQACNADPVDYINGTNNFVIASAASIADGLVSVSASGNSVGGGYGNCSGGRQRTFTVNSAGPWNVSAGGSGCTDEWACKDYIDPPQFRCGGSGSGSLDMTNDSTQGAFDTFSQTFSGSNAGGGTSTFTVTIP